MDSVFPRCKVSGADHVTVAVVGAGQAGLAMSRCLSRRGIDHVLIERGRVAERWRSERWDSLRLLTPNWMTRLPDHRYVGDDPDGFMTMPEVVAMFDRYAAAIDAPVREETAVLGVARTDDGYLVATTSGPVSCRFLVAATGACATPHIPEPAAAVPSRVVQTSPKHYRSPDHVGTGGVLVVGASASGVQLADELHRSGRDVVLATGDHSRAPRRYRGLDIHEWLDLTGTLDRAADRREPSLQLVGSHDDRTIDLATLQRLGVRIAGRLSGVRHGVVQFDGSAAAAAWKADARLTRLLDRIDAWASEHGLDAELDGHDRPAPVSIERELVELDLRAVDTVIWATGYRPDFSWLGGRIVEPNGDLAHDRGVATRAPDLYVLGLPSLRTRRSTFIDGVGADAEAHAAHIADRLAGTALRAQSSLVT